jgi:hypothetical protein
MPSSGDRFTVELRAQMRVLALKVMPAHGGRDFVEWRI